LYSSLENVLPEEFLNNKKQAEFKTVNLKDDENKVYRIIETEPKHVDVLHNT
jgi:hypothetical protein